MDRAAAMKGAGPQHITTRSAMSGTARAISSDDMRPVRPGHEGSAPAVSGSRNSRSPLIRPASSASSSRKTKSCGVRPACRNTTSASPALSAISRSIDITGVIPEPPDRNRYFRAGASGRRKVPRGPCARTEAPGVRLSCSQFDTTPPATRLTVMVKAPGRVGGEEML